MKNNPLTFDVFFWPVVLVTMDIDGQWEKTPQTYSSLQCVTPDGELLRHPLNTKYS